MPREIIDYAPYCKRNVGQWGREGEAQNGQKYIKWKTDDDDDLRLSSSTVSVLFVMFLLSSTETVEEDNKNACQNVENTATSI